VKAQYSHSGDTTGTYNTSPMDHRYYNFSYAVNSFGNLERVMRRTRVKL
jgi:hypothetical protein